VIVSEPTPDETIVNGAPQDSEFLSLEAAIAMIAREPTAGRQIALAELLVGLPDPNAADPYGLDPDDSTGKIHHVRHQ
jgi:hypothetical protein